mmetsp:Transcript_29267/g.54956  ORF Transcript_29267/g.54956 Transcript_29267/m.54956 type:complete len:115 (+) Transcript_29267:151-495(+)
MTFLTTYVQAYPTVTINLFIHARLDLIVNLAPAEMMVSSSLFVAFQVTLSLKLTLLFVFFISKYRWQGILPFGKRCLYVQWRSDSEQQKWTLYQRFSFTCGLFFRFSEAMDLCL